MHLGTIPEMLDPEAVVILKSRFPDRELMRTIPVIDDQSLLLAQQDDGLVDDLLLDTDQPGDTQVGATGRPHDWNLSRGIVGSVHTPVILAGGLGPQNVAEAIRTVRPAGVDSKTHTDQGGGPCRDIAKVRACVRIATSRPLLMALNPDRREDPGQDLAVLDNDWPCITHLSLALAEAKEASPHETGNIVREVLSHLVRGSILDLRHGS